MTTVLLTTLVRVFRIRVWKRCWLRHIRDQRCSPIHNENSSAPSCNVHHTASYFCTALARRPRPGPLQAGSDSSPASERPRTTVGLCVGVLDPGLHCWHATASAFRQPSPTCRTAFPAQHLRPSGVLSCWPDGLELSPGFYLGSNEQYRLF